MLIFIKRIILLISLLPVLGTVFAQEDTALLRKLVIPLNRQLAHEQVDREQKSILASDGKADDSLRFSQNEEINFLATRALTSRIDWIQYGIEKDSTLNHNKRLYYLKGLRSLLKQLQGSFKRRQLDPVWLPAIVDGFSNAMKLDKAGRSIAPFIQSIEYPIGEAIVRSGAFDSNPGIKSAREGLLLKYCTLHPSETLLTLKNNPDLPFTDSLVRRVAKKYPLQLYSYAQSATRLGALIRDIKDDEFIVAVTRMSRSKSGQQYFPFLDNIIKGKMTLEEIDAADKDSLQYYRLLVKTQVEYVQRAINHDTAFAFRELTAKLEKKAKDIFVNTINALHEEPDAVRFRILQSLTAPELYYLAVLSDGLIYTSSYTKGVYPLMMKRVGNRGDSLLLSVSFDHYRKFISQAAAYNTLGNFLASFPGKDDAKTLMRAFAGNLEKSEGLEDGVDVADSYASIIEYNKELAANMLALVKENYDRNVEENNQRGIHIYNILYKLFLSADSTNNINLTSELGIPPVYSIPYSALAGDKEESVIQMFFYGDEDGRLDYSIFQGMFNNGNWKVDKSNPQWTYVRSIKGKAVSIYANTPFDEETGKDDEAQQALGKYFEEKNIHPTVTINRGHSYHAETTISYMSPESRIVFMGSCGGFHLIDAILKKSADAHIIASKQIGKRDINRPFLQLLAEKLRNGSNIDWIPFWKEFRNSARVDGFEDYIPPYKNLGAIFIKAYGNNQDAAL